jgi:dGTPase
MSFKAHRLLSDLFLAYVAEPLQLPHEVQARILRGPDPLQRVVCDYIAGMTDRYAILEHKKLFDPEAQG